MGTETKSEHITPVGGNVFADLGFAPAEAAALKAESAKRLEVAAGRFEVPDDIDATIEEIAELFAGDSK